MVRFARFVPKLNVRASMLPVAKFAEAPVYPWRPPSTGFVAVIVPLYPVVIPGIVLTSAQVMPPSSLYSTTPPSQRVPPDNSKS